MTKEVKWEKEPKKGNYPAALSYLTLIYPESSAKALVERLKDADISEFASKDIFRASGLPELPLDNYHVKKNAAKIATGESISPLLLVRDEINKKVIIADGAHRLSAVYAHDEDAMIPVKIV